MPTRSDKDINPEQIAYWFFRINGCFTFANFLVHAERRGFEGTDADVLAVRFPHRIELALSDNPMQDHRVLESNGKVDLIIAEVKKGKCSLNGPWTDPDRRNMQRVLHAIGAFDDVEPVAKALYAQNRFEDSRTRVRLFALGSYVNPDLRLAVVQLTWDDVLRFIYQRFYVYRDIKAQHEQWDDLGKLLYDEMMSSRGNEDRFVTTLSGYMHLPALRE